MSLINYLRISTLCLVCLFLTEVTFSQEGVPLVLDEQWTLVHETNELKVSVKSTEVNVGSDVPFEYGLVRLENTSGNPLTVEFYFELNYKNGCVACGETREYVKQVVILENGVLTGDEFLNNPDLTFLITNPYQVELGKFISIKSCHIQIL